MRNFEKAFRFLIKNWIIAIPTAIGCVIISILVGILQLFNIFSSLSLIQFSQLDQLAQNEYAQSMNLSYLIPIYAMAFAVSIFSVIISFLYYPIMAGLVHESMRNNRIIKITDLFVASKEAFLKNIKKYAKYFAANLVIGLVFSTIIFLIILLFVALGITLNNQVITAVMILLVFVLIIVIFALLIVYGSFTSM